MSDEFENDDAEGQLSRAALEVLLAYLRRGFGESASLRVELESWRWRGLHRVHLLYDPAALAPERLSDDNPGFDTALEGEDRALAEAAVELVIDLDGGALDERLSPADREWLRDVAEDTIPHGPEVIEPIERRDGLSDNALDLVAVDLDAFFALDQQRPKIDDPVMSAPFEAPAPALPDALASAEAALAQNPAESDAAYLAMTDQLSGRVFPALQTALGRKDKAISPAASAADAINLSVSRDIKHWPRIAGVAARLRAAERLSSDQAAIARADRALLGPLLRTITEETKRYAEANWALEDGAKGSRS